MANSCNGCGLCCRLFFINLSKKEYETGTYKTMFRKFKIMGSFKEIKEIGANLLAKNDDGSCIYLKNNKCSIHKNRPGVCRDFFCTTKAKRFEGMVGEIKTKDTEKISSILID